MVAQQLPALVWRLVTWFQESRGPQRLRCGVIQVWAAPGWREQRHPERDYLELQEELGWDH
jgi:hypothetical protein